MYAYIKGEVAHVREDSLVVDNNGIGYLVYVPAQVTEGGVRKGDTVTLHTHFVVREDAMLLYGFLTEDELDAFRLLLGVSGVGPKAALAVISGMGTDALRFAVLSNDAAKISKVPGIGKKTSQKIILELKDKVELADAFNLKSAHTEEAALSAGGGAEGEAVMALVALGYPNADALRAVRKAADGMDNPGVEELLKAALREI
ncbi:MAG: Holliday junction branch migration protein RuvA [Lachnospiraceae bacterium]|nr:Holliday junction branch migration protein RuvA [Lachnospiraceae bacterium]